MSIALVAFAAGMTIAACWQAWIIHRLGGSLRRAHSQVELLRQQRDQAERNSRMWRNNYRRKLEELKSAARLV